VICVTPVTPDLSELLVGLLQVRGFPQVLVGVQVDVGVVLPLRRVAVALLALLQALWVRLLVVLLALPVRLVRVEVRVLQVVAVVEPGGGVGARRPQRTSPTCECEPAAWTGGRSAPPSHSLEAVDVVRSEEAVEVDGVFSSGGHGAQVLFALADHRPLQQAGALQGQL